MSEEKKPLGNEGKLSSCLDEDCEKSIMKQGENVSECEWRIEFPPLLETFHLPRRKELLAVRPGDHVKLMFFDADPDRDPEEGIYCERMWVEVTDTSCGQHWRGLLLNLPILVPGIKPGDEVVFHPLQVIDIEVDDSETRGELES